MRTVGAAVVAAAAVMLAAAPQAHAQVATQSREVTQHLTVSIVSPANGGGSAGQTLEAGVFALKNDSTSGDAQSVGSITLTFSDPSLISSATLSGPGARFDVHGPSGRFGYVSAAAGPFEPTVSRPAGTTTFTFNPPIEIPPGSEMGFTLTVKLSDAVGLNEGGNVAYASMVPGAPMRGAGAPLWMALAIVGLTMAALAGGTRRRAWLIAGLLILLAAEAPGCGSDSAPSTTQTEVAVAGTPVLLLPSDVRPLTLPPTTIGGLPLRLGTLR